MTEKDKRLIETARYIRSDYMYIAELRKKAETDEAREILEEIEDKAFAVHERIAFEHYA